MIALQVLNYYRRRYIFSASVRTYTYTALYKLLRCSEYNGIDYQNFV